MEKSLSTITGKVVAYFGDLRMAAYMGSRRGINIVAVESYYFNQDAVAIRGTQRFDINIHERGTATTSGAIVALVAG
jgi:HK97 family phage major capsid protein